MSLHDTLPTSRHIPRHLDLHPTVRLLDRHPDLRRPGLVVVGVIVLACCCAVPKPAAIHSHCAHRRLWVMPQDKRVLISNSLGQPVLEAIVGTRNGDFAGIVKGGDGSVLILVGSLG